MSKALKAKDLRGTAPAELEATIKRLREDLFRNRLKKSTNQLENVMLIRTARRDIARLNTILSEQLQKGKESAVKVETGPTAEAKEK